MKLNVLICLPFTALAAIPFGMENALTTSNVPQDFLEYAFLVGSFPMTALRSDPRVSYGLYIPKDHYKPNANSTQEKLPLLVDVHGTGRTLSGLQVQDQLPSLADSGGFAVVSPLFPTGFEQANDINSYKLLRTPTLRSDLALLSILDEIAYRWPGIETSKVYMSGFSGGGQYTHRFLYLHPERVAAASIGAPGRVTYPNNEEEWPEGLSNVEDLFSLSAQFDKMRQVKLQFVIGENDTEIYGGGSTFWDWAEEALGSTDNLPPMEQSRMDTIQKLRDSWTARKIESQLTIVPGQGHDGKSNAIRKALWSFLIDNMGAAKIKT